MLSVTLLSKDWIVIWGAIALGLIWILTGMISARLLVLRWTLRKILGSQRCHVDYAGIVIMLLESAVLLSSFATYFLAACSTKAPSLVMMPFLLTQIQVGTFLQLIEWLWTEALYRFYLPCLWHTEWRLGGCTRTRLGRSHCRRLRSMDLLFRMVVITARNEITQMFRSQVIGMSRLDG